MKFTLKDIEHKKWYDAVYGNHSSMDKDFYESPEWRKLRRACFYRDNYICQRCDKRFTTENLNVHQMGYVATDESEIPERENP